MHLVGIFVVIHGYLFSLPVIYSTVPLPSRIENHVESSCWFCSCHHFGLWSLDPEQRLINFFFFSFFFSANVALINGPLYFLSFEESGYVRGMNMTLEKID